MKKFCIIIPHKGPYAFLYNDGEQICHFIRYFVEESNSKIDIFDSQWEAMRFAEYVELHPQEYRIVDATPILLHIAEAKLKYK